MLLSIIIPVYNEKSTVAEVIKTISALDLPLEKEIIVVDDGSDDGTAEQLQIQEDRLTRLYTNPVNVGKGAAVRIGLKFAKGDIILIQDADLETDPNEYIDLLTPILEGKTKVVFGSRFLRKNTKTPKIRRLANYLLTKTTNLLYRSNFTDIATAYKVFSKDIAKKIELHSNGFEIDAEMTTQLCKLGIDVKEVPISYNPRTKSEGKKIKFKDGIRAVWTLISYRFK